MMAPRGHPWDPEMLCLGWSIWGPSSGDPIFRTSQLETPFGTSKPLISRIHEIPGIHDMRSFGVIIPEIPGFHGSQDHHDSRGLRRCHLLHYLEEKGKCTKYLYSLNTMHNGGYHLGVV